MRILTIAALVAALTAGSASAGINFPLKEASIKVGGQSLGTSTIGWIVGGLVLLRCVTSDRAFCIGPRIGS